jgi:hypothetical protein
MPTFAGEPAFAVPVLLAGMKLDAQQMRVEPAEEWCFD